MDNLLDEVRGARDDIRRVSKDLAGTQTIVVILQLAILGQGAAIGALSALHRREDVALLQDLAQHPDPNLAGAARDAVEEIQAFTKEK